ncbi:hypothetical protein VNO80_15994 [Phaseolus coccineus]|uniref:Uncharacterized protein n=1 Tax=Phaseolus coccineus TaxID=3886 RepID=A0AAN9R3H1_PHACN
MSLSSKLSLHFSDNARFNHNYVHHHLTALKIRASNDTSSSGSGTNLVFLSSTVTVTIVVANRLLYKLALVPMKDYLFLLAQFITFGLVGLVLVLVLVLVDVFLPCLSYVIDDVGKQGREG